MKRIDLCGSSCIWAICLCAGSILLASAAAQAASPSLGGITPCGGQRGTELEVTFNGGNLDDVREIMFYETGIEVAKLDVVNAGSVKARLKIAPECQLGAHRLRLRTATGISDLRTFFVGALPTVAEVEPNNDFKMPQAVPMNVTVTGVAENEDVDFFVVEAKKGDRITAEVEGIRLGITLFDAYVAILNSARFELSSNDDNALVWQDGIASVIAPEDGKYIVQVRETSYSGNGSCIYRLHIGNFTRPLATLPAGGKLGEQVSVRFLGDVAGEKEQVFTLPNSKSDRFAIFANDASGIAPSPNWFRISEFGNVLEQEPNETHDAATRFTPPMALNGVLSNPGDVDFFRFTAKKGEVYDVRVHARSLRSPLDSVLTIMNAGGGALAANDDSGGPDSFIRFGVPADGDFIIHVRDHLGNGGPQYAYRVELTPVRPQLNLSVAEFVQYVQPTVSIPKGNRFALMLNAARADFGGALTLKGVDLPAGVTIESPGAPANLSTIPVLFTAAADAPVAGAFVDLVGALDDPEKKTMIEGRMRQDVVLVRGQNQIPFWTETVERMTVAVTEEAPFTIVIVEPKVPLVQNGAMQLKVIATRKAGFTAPIKVDLLWFPPGLNASRSIAIAEGQSEALIPMNAAGNAPVAEWKIAVTGQATVGNGPVMVSTPFANLRVAEQYLTFAYDAAAVEQGKDTEVVIKIAKSKDFAGAATVDLLGLPNKVTAPQMTVTKDMPELVFKVKTEKDSPAGSHKSLFCQVVVMENDEPVLHNLGTGQIRIDVPLPPKKDEPPPAAVAAPKPVEAAAPPKRLTRLEQLRLEQQNREKAKAGGGEKPAGK